MKKRAKVKFLTEGDEWKKGEIGYIDSYTCNQYGSFRPIIIKEDGDIIVGTWCSFKVINFNELGE